VRLSSLRGGRPTAVTLAAVLAVTLAWVPPADGHSRAAAGVPANGAPASVVVQGEGAAAALARVGGRIQAALPLIGGLLANVPAGRQAELRAAPGVRAVTSAERRLTVLGRHDDEAASGDQDSPAGQGAAERTDAWRAWGRTTGSGVAVAVVDTGIADVADLDGRVVARADLTGERSFGDSYGHGTFMAGLIAGSGGRAGPSGVAPGADLVDLKVAGRDGSTTLGQVLYALQLADASRDRFDIKVLNLSLGAPADDPATAPLTEAVERLWADGIVVVTASGNDGEVTAPGIDPYVITVGALDQGQRAGRGDDSVPSWSGDGPDYAGRAKPDLVAPGVGTVSVRAPGSTIDTDYPAARVGTRWFRGSGTSMATAVVSGTAALIAAEHRGWGPDKIKGALVGEADELRDDLPPALDVPGTVAAGKAAAANQDLVDLGGPWDVEAPVDPGADATSMRWRDGDWDGQRWGGRGWTARQWAAADWNARQWAAGDWSGRQWAGRQWAARQWAARQWAARQWAAAGYEPESWAALQWTWAAPAGWTPRTADNDEVDWIARQWAARQWAGRQWAGRQWAARQWAAQDWAGRQWAARQWAGRQWAAQDWAARQWAGRQWAGRQWAARQWAARTWGAGK
jgi:serine protease AprX